MIRIATAALTLLLAYTLAAQDTPPTFKAESQVVVLDVVARDGRGRPVSDLRPDDIQVSRMASRARSSRSGWCGADAAPASPPPLPD
jgi:uncharacterized protein involved in exopolysaccharide biosynthesis